MEENELNKTFFELCENLLVKPINKPSRSKNSPNIDGLFKNYSISGVSFKNKLCFLGLNDNCFCDRNGIPSDEYFEFYKKIAKSGVGLIVTGGAYAGLNLFSVKHKRNYSKIGYSTEEADIYSAFTRLLHTFGTKVFFKIKTIFGRGDDKNGVFCNFSRTASKIRCYNNCLLPTVKLSDGKCDKIVQEISKMAKFAVETDFDGIMIDASLFGLIGEFSSHELNTRKLGYYSEKIDFLKKILNKFKEAGIRKNIFLEMSISSFCKNIFGKDFLKIKTIKNFEKDCSEKVNLEFLESLVKLGVDGFIFKFGTFETEFLSTFNAFESENLLKNIYLKIQKYFDDKNILNK